MFAGALIFLLLQHNWWNPGWVPVGSDWDQWLRSVLALSGKAAYPPQRWPAWGALLAGVNGLTPGPLYLKAQLVSLVLTAAAVAGVHRLARRLLGPVGALAAATLVATLPVVGVIGGWCNAYALWAATAVWAVTAVSEGAHRPHGGWWALAGLCVGLHLAVMEKGLALGLVLGGLLLATVLLRGGRRRLHHALLALLPVALLAGSYALFEGPLSSLDWAVKNRQLNLTGPGEPPEQPAPRPVAANQTAPDFSQGYVFGKAMGPTTVWRALTRAAPGSSSWSSDTRRGKLLRWARASYPAVGLGWLALLLFAPALALMAGGRRRLARAAPGWIGLCGVVALMVPALGAELDHRFLLPGYAVIPLFLVAPAAVATRRWRGRGQWLGLGVLLVALIPGSPWVQRRPVQQMLVKLEARSPNALAMREVVRQAYPELSMDAILPGGMGVLLMDDREGYLHGMDPRYHAPRAPAPGRHLLQELPLTATASSAAGPPPPAEHLNAMRRRRVLWRCPVLIEAHHSGRGVTGFQAPASELLLFSPVGAPATP